MTIINAGLDLLDPIEDEKTQRLGEHETLVAPLIDHDAAEGRSLDQYGVLGRIWSINDKNGSRQVTDGGLYCNINSPFSAVVCGVQGSGKSHTLAVLLESMLISDPRLGHLPSPLSALVLHFGESGSTSKPCEAAFVGQSDDPSVDVPAVNVFCSPSAFGKTRALYDRLGGGMNVWPLYFTEEDIDAQSLLALMAVEENGHMPLYMHVVLTILSDLGANYTFHRFRDAIKRAEFDGLQRKSLELRLQLLESFLCKKSGRSCYSVKTNQPVSQPEEKFVAGGLTIVDLTDPFISPGTACSLFEIVLKLFNRADINSGKAVVLDEAHKYLSEVGKGQTEGSKRLTERMISFTRQQRHLAMRIIISTQEPTVIPASLLDLCSMIMCHRFYSTGWWAHLGKHVSTDLTEETFDKVVTLKTGHCLIFSPTALVAKGATVASDFGKLSLHDSGTVQPSNGWTVDSNAQGGWNTKPVRSNSPPLSTKRLSSWDTSEPNGNSAGKHESESTGWTHVQASSGWNSDPVKDDTRDGTSSSGHTDFQDPEEEVSRPISQDNARVKVETGLDTPVDSVKHLSPSESKSADPASSGSKGKDAGDEKKEVEHLGRGYLVVKTRRRVTVDGGRSLLAIEKAGTESQDKSHVY